MQRISCVYAEYVYTRKLNMCILARCMYTQVICISWMCVYAGFTGCMYTLHTYKQISQPYTHTHTHTRTHIPTRTHAHTHTHEHPPTYHTHTNTEDLRRCLPGAACRKHILYDREHILYDTEPAALSAGGGLLLRKFPGLLQLWRALLRPLRQLPSDLFVCVCVCVCVCVNV